MPLGRALLREKDVSPLPVPWSGLSKFVQPRRGDLVLVMGYPHAGKSLLALAWALGAKVPTTLISLDTSLFNQAVRAAAMLSGFSADAIRKQPEKWAQLVNDKAPFLRAYDFRLDVDEMNELLVAEAQFWGKTPDLLILDNAGDLATAGFDGYRDLMVNLRYLARQARVCVFALHHTRKQQEGDSLVPRLWDALYAGDREADIALGVANGGDNIQVYVLKNRSGDADVSGAIGTQMHFDRRCLRLTETHAWHQLSL